MMMIKIKKIYYLTLENLKKPTEAKDVKKEPKRYTLKSISALHGGREMVFNAFKNKIFPAQIIECIGHPLCSLSVLPT